MADSPSELNAAVEKLERKHNENPEGRYFAPLADNYRKLGELETAEQLLREGLRRHPDYLSAHVVLGRCLVDRGALADARSEFGHVLSVDPQNLVALKAMGEIAAGSGERGEAEHWYRELLAVDPMNEDARTALASLEESAGAPAELGEAVPEQDGASWEPLAALDLDPGPADAAYDSPTSAPKGVAEDDVGIAWDRLPAEDDAPAAPASGEDARREDVRRDAVPQGVDDAAFEPHDLDLELPGFSPSGLEADGEEGEEGAASFRLDGLEGSSGFEPVEEEPEPADEEEEEVVTETIAELYAQQGFHDRAAEVYRRLLRERGEDAGLRERLEEMERLSRGEAVAPAAAAEPWESGDVPAVAGEEPSLPNFGETTASGAAEPWGEPAGREDDRDDPFASSFRYGFAGAPAEGGWPAAADERATGWADGTATTDEGADPWLSSGAGFAAPGVSADAGAGFDPSGLYDDAGADQEVGDGDEADAAGFFAPDMGVASGSTFGSEQAPSDATGGDDYDAEPWEIGSLEHAEPVPGRADAAPDESEGAWGGAQATDAALHGETSRPASVRAYLSELIAWPAGPSGATRAAEAPTAEAPTIGAPTIGAPTTEGAEEPAWRMPNSDETPAERRGAGFGTEEEAAVAAGPETEPFAGAPGVPGAEQGDTEPNVDTGAADDLLPWEQPVDSDAGAGAADGGGFSFEDFFDEKNESALAPEAAPAAEKPAPAPESEPEPEPSRPEDEEDLESFQAWLRGLRR